MQQQQQSTHYGNKSDRLVGGLTQPNWPILGAHIMKGTFDFVMISFAIQPWLTFNESSWFYRFDNYRFELMWWDSLLMVW